MSLQFEWDSAKAVVNRRKHGVSFDEAVTVFRDPLAAIFEDEGHSVAERRELIIGRSVLGHLLIVSFVERAEGKVRVISARETTAWEKRDYETNR
jgi:uncharacterized protein